jgi:hypothetical protein
MVAEIFEAFIDGVRCRAAPRSRHRLKFFWVSAPFMAPTHLDADRLRRQRRGMKGDYLMHKRPTDSAKVPSRKSWNAPTLTVLPAEDAENAPTAVQGDGPISMGS